MRANQIPRRPTRCHVAAFRADVYVVVGRDAKAIERPIIYCVTDAISHLVVSMHVASREDRASVEASLRRTYG